MTRLARSAELRFLSVLPKADRGLTFAWWALILIRGALPAMFTLAMGAVVGAVQTGQPLTRPLAAAGIVFIALNALGPIHEAVAADLGARTGAWLLRTMAEAGARSGIHAGRAPAPRHR